MPIEGLYTHNMRNDMHFQFHLEVIKQIEKFDAIEPRADSLFGSYKLLHEKEDLALKKIRGSSYTKRISDADKERDIAWYGMLNANEAALKHYDPAVVAGACELQVVFRTYGNVARKRLNEQTSALHNIIQDFKGRYAPFVAAAGLAGWVNELEARNDAFASLVRQRYDDNAAKSKLVLKDVRAEVNAAYRALIHRLNSFFEMQGVGQYQTLIDTLNEISSSYAASANRPRKNPPKSKEPGK